MSDPTLHGVDKGLSAHIAECVQWRQRVVADIKSLKRIIVIAFGLLTAATCGLIVALATVAWALLRQSLNLH